MDAHQQPGALDALIQDGLAMQVRTISSGDTHFFVLMVYAMRGFP